MIVLAAHHTASTVLQAVMLAAVMFAVGAIGMTLVGRRSR